MLRPTISLSLLSTLTLCTLGSTAALCGQIVSPVGYASSEPTGNNAFPFAGPAFTYQQVHADIRGTPRPITGMAFRRDGTLSSAYHPRVVTVDVWLGDSDISTISATFATNFQAPPLQVVTNRTVNLPDHTAVPVALPAPFTAVVPFDVPYIYTGLLDLLWEMRVTTNSDTSFYAMDSASGTGNASMNGTVLEFGTGCTTVRGVMKLRWTGTTTSTLHTLRWGVANGPASTQVSVLAGLLATFPLPGLCESVFTTGTFFSFSGTTNTTGGYTTPTGVTFPYNPTVTGFLLATQAVALDASQPGIPLSLSNGLLVTIPDVGPAVQCARIFAVNTATATAGTVGNNFSLITQFR